MESLKNALVPQHPRRIDSLAADPPRVQPLGLEFWQADDLDGGLALESEHQYGHPRVEWRRRILIQTRGLTPFCRRLPSPLAPWRTIDAPHCPRTVLLSGRDGDPGWGSSMMRCLVVLSSASIHPRYTLSRVGREERKRRGVEGHMHTRRDAARSRNARRASWPASPTMGRLW